MLKWSIIPGSDIFNSYIYQKLNERSCQAIKDCDCNKYSKVVDKQACHPYEQLKTYFSFARSNH